jgi:fluoroquinolone transport system ATP-binding protein
MIAVNNLNFTYPGTQAPAVQDVSFEIQAGQILGFLGPNGAGKSTVQKLMIGLLPLSEGDIRYSNKPLSELGKAFFNQIGVSFE